MRKQSRYLPEDIQTSLFTSGSQWQTLDGIEYIGTYHQYTTGEIYTKSEWNPSTSKQLVPYQPEVQINRTYSSLKPDINVAYEPIPVFHIQINGDDINRGFITRYIAYDVIRDQTRNISMQTYLKIQNRRCDPNQWKAVQLQWKITGPIQTTHTYQGNALGIESYNRLAVQQAEKQVPGISKHVTNYTEFITDGEFIVPADINK